MDDAEAYEYYADPAHRAISGPGRKHPKDMLTRMLSVRISPSLLRQATACAASEGRPVGAWARRALRNEVERSGWRADERRRRAAALAGASEVAGGRAVTPGSIPRPEGLIEGSGRRGEPKALRSSLPLRTFACPHLSVGNVTGVICATCGPLRASA